MSFKEELLQELKDWGEFTTKALTHQLRLSRLKYPTYYTTIKRLEEEGILKKKKRGKYMLLSITPKGKALLRKPTISKMRHDGLSTIITFDIPEEQSRARRTLRRYLISHGYTLLQESVLIAPTHATNELKELIRELGIYHHVKIIAGRIEYN